MSSILRIKEPAASSARAPNLHALLELAFRRLYLFGTAWALAQALYVWRFAPILIRPRL